MVVKYSTSFAGPYVVTVRYALPFATFIPRVLVGSSAIRIFGRGWFVWNSFRQWSRWIH